MYSLLFYCLLLISEAEPIEENDFDTSEKNLRARSSFNNDFVTGKIEKGQRKALASRKENEAPTPPPKVPES